MVPDPNKKPMFDIKPVTGTVDKFGNRIQLDYKTGLPTNPKY
jgi:hypothetical protein